MVGFSIKKISNPLSLSESLKSKREEQGIDLFDAAKKINVSAKYLQALESGRLDFLPGEVYAKNFIKVYAEFLGFNSAELISAYQSEKKIYGKTSKIKNQEFKKPIEKVSSTHFIITPKIFRSLLVALLAFICIAYLVTRVKAITDPPELVVDFPASDLVVNEELIEIKGRVEKEAVLEINGQKILVDQDGGFLETINLQKGINIIEVKAVKRHGRENKVYRQIVLNNTDD